MREFERTCLQQAALNFKLQTSGLVIHCVGSREMHLKMEEWHLKMEGCGRKPVRQAPWNWAAQRWGEPRSLSQTCAAGLRLVDCELCRWSVSPTWLLVLCQPDCCEPNQPDCWCFAIFKLTALWETHADLCQCCAGNSICLSGKGICVSLETFCHSQSSLTLSKANTLIGL